MIRTALKEKFDHNMKDHNKNLNSKFEFWVKLEAASLFFSLAGLAVAILDYELSLGNGSLDGLKDINGDGTNADWDTILEHRMHVGGTGRLRILVAICSGLAIAFLALRNINQVAWKNNFYNKQIQREELGKTETEFVTLDMSDSKHADVVRESRGECRHESEDPLESSRERHAYINKEDESFDSKRNPTFNTFFWIEIILYAIFPWPYIDKIFLIPQLATAGLSHVAYFYSDIALVIMFLRITAAVRHLERYHEFTDIYSKQVCQSHYGFVPSRLFSIKIEMINNPSRVAAILFLSSILILAEILRIFELPWEINNAINSVDLKDYGSAIWLTIITSTTVGYGDIYPHTVGGQCIIVLTAFWGTFLVSLLVLVVANVFDLSGDEQKAIAYIR